MKEAVNSNVEPARRGRIDRARLHIKHPLDIEERPVITKADMEATPYRRDQTVKKAG